MLCHLCETFLTNILHQDFQTWRRVEEGWFTFKHGNYATVAAAAEAGCKICGLLNRVREDRIPNYLGLSEKWHVQSASIDVKYDCAPYSPPTVRKPAIRKQVDEHITGKYAFQLLTLAPDMSWIAFELFHPNGSDEGDFALAVENDPTSVKATSIAKEWIDGCSTAHTHCQRPDDARLPTRVIDVGPSDDSIPRLHVAGGQKSRYVTLSHCWGTGDRLTLTKGRIHNLQRAISYGQLPRTFQDAIRLTRALGIRYLWLDALCIIQDDQDDWRRESASMGAVFENALFSISALTAVDSHSGMLHHRSPPSIELLIGEAQIGVRTRADTLPLALRSARLETRAWCFQERLLPTAILHVAPDQMHWECRSGHFSESFPDLQTKILTPFEPLRISLQSKRVRNYATIDWLDLIKEYSNRAITKPSDRLPAIAGVVDRIGGSEDDVMYIQGLWSNGFHEQLLWRRRGKLAHTTASSGGYVSSHSSPSAETSEGAPCSSWSWASVNDAVEWPLNRRMSCKQQVTSADAEFSEKPSHGYPIEGTAQHIGLKGFMKRGSCKISTAAPNSPSWVVFKPSGSLLKRGMLNCSLDYSDEPVAKSCYCLRITKWLQASTIPGPKAFVSYLLLEKVGTAETTSRLRMEYSTFKRIGMGFDDAEKVDRIFANAERRQLRLI
ncbi:uncharacterized protein LTR77_001031 [Saxophila tyrrhenica]|uniref:Heterokaryon incompatibility domain-containing protein n=1 Tax=Saxophila tyrrhenica TaxID=1690608 RepID=A0AAV9PQ03_9PEZI|nr:hypothetical protein LTR77_001031 [Saxophila tyrrhenica]